MSDSYIIETVEKPTRYYMWDRGLYRWTTDRVEAHLFTEENREQMTLPKGGCWVSVREPEHERERQLTKRLTGSEFAARGLGRSRYHDRLFEANLPRPSNDQFDEGWEAARQFYTKIEDGAAARDFRELAREALAETRDCDECSSPATWERYDDPETSWHACDKHTGTALGWSELKTVRLALRIAAVAAPPDGQVEGAAEICAEMARDAAMCAAR